MVVLWLLSSIPTAALGALAVALAVTLAVSGLLLLRRRVAVSLLVGHNDVAGFIYAVLGVIYAVLVPFVLVIVWEEFRDAQTDAAQEAQTLFTLRQDARQLPTALGQPIVDLEVRYARAVVDDEWPLLALGRESPSVDAALAALEDAARALDPADPRQAVLYDHLLGHLNALADDREARVIDSRTAIPPVLWIVLGVGGILVVGYTYLYGVERLVSQALMTAALAAMIALVLFVILAMDYPFTGDLQVPPNDILDFLSHATASP